MKSSIEVTSRKAPETDLARRCNRLIRRLVVFRRPGLLSKGILMAPHGTMKCALGRAGVSRFKREGDGTTPVGVYHVLGGFFRSDRITRMRSGVAIASMRRSHAWCDDPKCNSYNQFVTLPFNARHERLWRNDRVYDILFILDYNSKPRRLGCGSAIFFHLARDGNDSTEGCIAISLRDMRRLMPKLSRHVVVEIR